MYPHLHSHGQILTHLLTLKGTCRHTAPGVSLTTRAKPSPSFSTTCSWGQNWVVEEMKYLIAFWGEEEIEEQCHSVYCNKEMFLGLLKRCKRRATAGTGDSAGAKQN